MQKLFGNHSGDKYLHASVTLSDNQDAVKKRIACSIVQDTKTGNVILKMVNILPVSAKTVIDLSGLVADGASAFETLLTGNPSNKELRPFTTNTTVTSKTQVELPAYSFT